MLRVLIRALALGVVGALIGMLLNWSRWGGVDFERESEGATCAPGQYVVETTPPDGAASLCSEVDTAILDVRSDAEFKAGHVVGAIHLPCNTDPLGDKMYRFISNAALVLVYGNSTEEARPVAEELADHNHNVLIIEGGYPAWEAAGQGCEAGPCDCTGSEP